jgi:UDP-glucose:glycoprotein glucosyltransferase
VRTLAALGLSNAESVALLTHPAPARAQAPSSGFLDGFYDASDREEGGGVVGWWNDIEKDSR